MRTTVVHDRRGEDLLEHTLHDLASEHMSIRGMRDAVNFKGGYGSWRGTVKDYINLLTSDKGGPRKKIRDLSPAVLWMAIANWVDITKDGKTFGLYRYNAERELVGFFFRPFALALAHNIKSGRLGSITLPDLARLTHTLGQYEKSAPWLEGENLAAALDLLSTCRKALGK
jgi:hypothetical protein